MIGFEMSATGSKGFRQKRAAWTEGSLVALKAIVVITDKLLLRKFGDKMSSTQKGAINSIEASFKKLAHSVFNRMCSVGSGITLFVSGDINFTYFFDPDRDTEDTAVELLRLLARENGGVGDQVVIYFSRIVEDFVIHTIGEEDNEPLILRIEIDL